MLACLLTEKIQGNSGEVRHGFIEVPERLFNVLRFDIIQHEHLVIGIKVPGDLIGILQFTKTFIVIAYGKCFQGSGDVTPHHGHNGA